MLRHCGLKDLSQVGKVQLKMAVAENFQFIHHGLPPLSGLQRKVRPFFFLKPEFTQKNQMLVVRPTFLESFCVFARVGKHSTLVFLRFKLQQWEREIDRNSELKLDDWQAFLP